MDINTTLTLPLVRATASGNPITRGANALLRGLVERVVPLGQINDLYRRAVANDGAGTFFDKALEAHGVSIEMRTQDRARIPASGGLIVVANHPFGAVEGMAVLSMIGGVRPDVRVLANHMLAMVPPLREHSFFVDPFGGREAARSNVRAVAQAIRWVESGGVLVIFPAGEVSHFQLGARAVVDPKWSSSVARIVRRAGVPVLPIYFHGRNTALFQTAGMLHPRLRTVLLPRELMRAAGRHLRSEVGSPIPFSRLSTLDDDALVRYLRERTYLLAHRADAEEEPRKPAAADSVPLASEESPDRVCAELAQLPMCRQLVVHEDFTVVFAAHDQIPVAMRELGRLRELAFRAVGEGTGEARDLDEYDERYHHLILWNRADRRIVGAYRVGQADEVNRWHGVRGLYTRSLFRYDEALLERLGPALELGRSFVHPDYQRSYLPLMLLWRGIGEYVLRHPHYRILFGAVSISDEYTSISQRIMSAFLRQHTYDHGLGTLVRPTRAPVARGHERGLERSLPRLVRSFDDVAALVRELERDERGVPVLLRQYLKLGGRLLGLNIDRRFSNVLDALLYVDLIAADRTMLERYMGPEGAAAYLDHHRRRRDDAPCSR